MWLPSQYFATWIPRKLIVIGIPGQFKVIWIPWFVNNNKNPGNPVINYLIRYQFTIKLSRYPEDRDGTWNPILVA